jgi:hypothetical protein
LRDERKVVACSKVVCLDLELLKWGEGHSNSFIDPFDFEIIIMQKSYGRHYRRSTAIMVFAI